MKKKIFISLATFFFAAITFYNVQVSQENGNISLEHIALMAEASDESGGGFVCYTSGTYEPYDNYRSCTTCKTVYHAKPNYWSESKCWPS